jgi:hypothetical protein
MVLYRCKTCLKFFNQKCHYKAHLARKNKCEPPSDIDDNAENITAENPHNHQKIEISTAQKLHQTAEILVENNLNLYNSEKIEKFENKCIYCYKSFIR